MLAHEIQSSEIVPLKTSASGISALQLMEEYRVSHLPIVNDTEFLGVISEDDIYDLDDPEQPIGNHSLSLQRPYVFSHQHIYEVIRQVSQNHLTLIPVLDDKSNYQGCILLKDLVLHFTELTGAGQPGAIIVLEVAVNDFTLAQIAQIVESNDAKILSMYTGSRADNGMIDVTLKLNRLDVTAILQTFYRYQYTVKASYSETDDSAGLMERYDLLMRFLNI